MPRSVLRFSPLAGPQSSSRSSCVLHAGCGSPLLDWDKHLRDLRLRLARCARSLPTDQYVASFPDPLEGRIGALTGSCCSPISQAVLAFGGLGNRCAALCLEHPVRALDLVLLDQRAFELVRRHLERDRDAARLMPACT